MTLFGTGKTLESGKGFDDDNYDGIYLANIPEVSSPEERLEVFQYPPHGIYGGVDVIVTSPFIGDADENHRHAIVHEPVINPILLSPPSSITGVAIFDDFHLWDDDRSDHDHRTKTFQSPTMKVKRMPPARKVNIISPQPQSSSAILQQFIDHQKVAASERNDELLSSNSLFDHDPDRLSPHNGRHHDRTYSGSGSTGSEDDLPFDHRLKQQNYRAYIHYHHTNNNNNNTNNTNNNNINDYNNDNRNNKKISIASSEDGPNNNKRKNKKYSTSSSQDCRNPRQHTMSSLSVHSRTSSFGSEGKEAKKKKAMKKLSTVSVSSSHHSEGRNRNRGRTMSSLSAVSHTSSFGSDASGRSNGSTMSTSDWIRKTSLAQIMSVTHAVSKFMRNNVDRRRVRQALMNTLKSSQPCLCGDYCIS